MHGWKLTRLVMMAAILFLAADADAQFFRSWIDSSGGAYGDPFNWSPSGVPDNSDGAGFYLNSTYGISFLNNQSTGIATVGAGSVTFNLNTSGTPRTFTVPGTLKINSAVLYVQGGTVDPGDLVIENDGVVIVQGNAAIKTGDASVVVTGQFSDWTIVSGFLRVGEFATGSLMIEDGASVFNDDGTAIGRFVGSNGTATITGSDSLLDVDANLTIGQEGAGTLVIEEGASVDSHLGLGHIAYAASSTGSVTVTGTDTSWISGGVNVGLGGIGTLNVEAGGSVSSGVCAIGGNSGSVGVATVTGVDSTWTSSSLLTVGGNGDGTLIVESGGEVSSLDGTIGRFAGSSGEATVSGAGSSWTIADELNIGLLSNVFATAVLTIAEQGSVSATSGFVGGNSGFLQPSPNADLIIDGAGSILALSGTLLVNESGMVEIHSGGAVQVNGDATVRGELVIGDGSVVSHDGAIFGSGDAVVSGAGSSWTMSGGLSIAGFSGPLFPSFAAPMIQSGGAVGVADGIDLSDYGFIVMDAGTLAADAITVSGNGQFDFLGGALSVDQFGGHLVNQGGALAPGQSAGSTTINGVYIQETGATLEIEIGGLTATTEHDFVLVNGQVLINGGELRLSLIDGFIPSDLHTFTVLDASVSIAGQFANAVNGERLDTADGLGSFLVHYGQKSVFNPNHIVLTSFEPACPADIDQDGAVNVTDLLALLAAWGDCPSPCPPMCAADVNVDCQVDVSDLLALLAAWGSCP